jgi:hypothetical protein
MEACHQRDVCGWLTPTFTCKGINKMQRRSRCYLSALDWCNATLGSRVTVVHLPPGSR